MLIIYSINFGSCLDQQPNNFGIFRPNGKMQWRPMSSVLRVNIDSETNQVLNHLRVRRSRYRYQCHMQEVPSISIASCIYVHPFSNQSIDPRTIPFKECCMCVLDYV